MTDDDEKGTGKIIRKKVKVLNQNDLSSTKVLIKPVKKGTGTSGESTNVNDFIKEQDIDQLIDLLRHSKNGNHQQIMDFDSRFVDDHVNGLEMFLQLAIELEPENPVHHYNYALLLENQKSYDKAKKEFQTAIKLDRANQNYVTDFGNLLLALNELEEAEVQYKHAIEINPNNAYVWTNLGIIYNNIAQPKKAESALRNAMDIDPTFPLSYINLLHLYKNQGEVEKANRIRERYKSVKVEDLDLNIMHLSKKKKNS